MSGGIFAINRHYFNELGQYDKDMNLWGAENLELSLRVIQILWGFLNSYLCTYEVKSNFKSCNLLWQLRHFST